jgi:hypothetical protein
VGVKYRAVGVLRVLGRRGQFEWPAIPAARRAALDAVRVTLLIPAGVVRLGEWGLAEAGWEVTTLPSGITATRAAVPPGVGGTVLAEVAVDPLQVVEPRWQHDAELARQLTPAFIAGGLFILTIGAGVIWLIRFEAASRRRHAQTPADGRDRQGTPEGLFVAGLVCLVFAVLAGALTYFMLGRYGPWAMAVPASILAVGILFLTAGRRPART